MKARPAVEIRALTAGDRPWAGRMLAAAWGSTKVVSRGVLHDLAELPGFLAWQASERVGLVTYRLAADECEVMSINSLAEGQGIGTALLGAVRDAARAAGCRRLWLITTNDNLPALRFYQKRGLRLAAVFPGSVDAARQLKPEIPTLGLDGIPLRDEIELEMLL